MTTQHIHTWASPDQHGTWACTSCTDTSPTCIIERPSDDPGEGHPTGIPAQAICHGCLRHEQGILDDIADALGHWQHQPRSIVPAIRYDRERINGSRTENDRPTIQTPSDVLDVLWDWAVMWAEVRSDRAPAGDVLGFLKRHILWAANNPDGAAWSDYRAEMRQMRHAARRVSGLLPQRQAAPCIHCGGQIVRDWATANWQPRIDVRPEHNGLSDIHRCTGCGLTWAHREAWMYANGHTLRLAPKFAPDTLVTLEDARKHIFPGVPAATWRKWLQRDRDRAEAGEERRIPERGTDVRGNDLYRVGDLATHVEYRTAQTRPGRKAG